jgi:hypothetical protein
VLFVAVRKRVAIGLLASMNAFISNEQRLLDEALSAATMRTSERPFTVYIFL